MPAGYAPRMDTIDPPYLAGLRRLSAGEPAKAIPLLRAALARDPDHAGARRNLVRALSLAGQFAATIAETHDTSAADAETYYLRGTAFNALGCPAKAIAPLTAAVALDPAHAPAWLNLGNAFADLDDLATAEAHCRRALALDPGLVEAHVSLGVLQTERGRAIEGLATHERAVQMWPDHPDANWSLAIAALRMGDLPRGFRLYEWRKRHPRHREDFPVLPGPVWPGPVGNGQDPAGRTILVRAEQGFGDAIQFARYLPEIRRLGGRPVLACAPPLIPLFDRVEGVRVVPAALPPPPYDAWIDQMSLPRVFGTTLDTIPAAEGYLRAAGPAVEAHRAGLPSGVLRVGVAWAGNPRHRNDRRRTPPPETFAPLLALPGVCFVNLVPDRPFPGLAMPARPLTDFAETAALIAALDLVVSVDTAVAHLAGALGRPVWIALPRAADWRWFLNSDVTPWYRSARLFRQPVPGAWPDVAARLAEALEIGLTDRNKIGRNDDG